MADYNANIRVNADTKGAESQLKKLQQSLNKLSDFTLKLNSRDIGREVNNIGNALRGIGERGALGAVTLAAGKATTAIAGLGTKFGLIGAAAASAGASINGALGGIPAVVGDILNQVGQIPNAFGIAAVAAMAFAPQLTKAAASAVGLGAAIDNAVGANAVGKIASAVSGVRQLELKLNASRSSFADLLGGSALNTLVAQLNDAQKQVGEFVAFTDESVTAVEQLLTVERLVTREKRAQAALYNQLNGDARQLKSRVQQNVIASRNGRAGSGFNAFSDVASALDGSSAVDKAIRRNFEKRARNAPPAPAAPLMLPSSEMLLAGGRRIERLTADPGLQAGKAFTQELQKAASTGSQLDGIFKQVQLAVGKTAQGAAEGNRITQSWTLALEQMAQLQSELTELTAKEAKLEKEAADARYLKLRALRTEEKIQAAIARNVEASDKRKATGRKAESLALGVGFPLLFGGGIGSVAGAAAGSFVGSGFGGQILGGAIGQIADQFAQAAAKTGNALRAPVENFKELADAGLLASKSQERYIERLIEAGKTTEAAALIQGEFIKKVGVDGVNNLQNAGAASDKLNKALAELNLQAQAAVAGPLAALTSWLAGIVAIGNQATRSAVRQTDIANGLSSKDLSSLKQQEQRILQGSNLFNESQKRAQVQRLYESYAPRANIKSPAAGGDTTAGQQARANTLELQAQNALAAKQLSLAGLTLEKDRGRYVQAARAVALQEYDNKLLEIKNSWIGKIFDKEKNLAMIRSANLEYSAKLRGLESQVAQQALTDRSSALQAELALYRTREESIAILVRKAEVEKGEEGGLRKRLELNDNLYNQQLAAYYTEKDIALSEAQKNGTVEQTLRLYDEKLKQLNAISAIERAQTEEKLRQLKLDKELANQQRAFGFTQDLANLYGSVPVNRTPLEELALQQAQRRDSMLAPKLLELDSLQQGLASVTGSTPREKVDEMRASLSRVNDEIGRLSNGLAYVEGQEIVWEKNRSGVEAFNNVLNGVGTTVTSVFADLITGTDNWTNSLQNALNAVANLLLQVGLTALGGNDGKGFFSILTGNFGKRAAGGPVTGGTPYIVGEKGPELFVPGRSGGIVPNNALGGGGGDTVVNGGINITVENTGDRLGPEAQKQIARQVQTIVMGTLVNERRSGGVLR